MDQLPALGKAIKEIVLPTHKVFEPLIIANAEKIRSVKKETFTYGTHERQQLDVYSPAQPKIVQGRRPVLVFEYGGGLIQGARTLPGFDGLVHANVGAFFALNFGYTVVIADYRLLYKGAAFPSGGEDLALAVEWIIQNQPGPGSEPIDLFMMGNSAGGVHLSTFLLHPSFAGTRQKVLTGSGTRLRGAILLSVPLDFDLSRPSLAEVMGSYFGDVEANCPLGLLRTARRGGKVLDIVQGGTRVFVLNGELDPEDDILLPRDHFLAEWALMTDNQSRCALAVDSMEGQNHISPFASLMSGGEREEAWGHQVGMFCDTARKFAPRN